MTSGAEIANAESGQRAISTRGDAQVTLLREIRDLLRDLLDASTRPKQADDF